MRIYKTLLLSVLSLAVLTKFTACSPDNESGMMTSSMNGGAEEVIITVSIPANKLPVTRSIDGTEGEAAVKTIDVLVFGPGGTPDSHEVILKHAKGENLTYGKNSAGHTQVQFTAKLSSHSGATTVALVANTPSVTESVASLTNKKDILKALTYALDTRGDGKWNANGATDNTPIPMYGETTVTGIEAGMNISGIDLTRMLARIDVKNNATTQFELHEVYVVNYNTAGYIAPAWNTANGVLSDTLPAIPMTPDAANAKLGINNAMVYTYADYNEGKGMYGEIYTFEAAALAGVDDGAKRANAACLIFKGKYKADGSDYYYRADFTARSGNACMPLYRNHRYMIDIKAVEGTGYDSASEALKSTGVINNLKTELLVVDESAIMDIVFNGQNYLGIEGKAQLRYIAGSMAEIACATDFDGGWQVESIEFAKGDKAWLSARKDGSDQSGKTNDLILNVLESNISVSDREAFVHLKAGRLTHRLSVIQKGISFDLILENNETISKDGGTRTATMSNFSDPLLKWAIKSIDTHSDTRRVNGKNYSLVNHSSVLTVGDAAARVGAAQPQTTTDINVEMPRVYFPNRELQNINCEVVVEIYTYQPESDSYTPSGITETINVYQEPLESQGVNIFNARSGWGSLARRGENYAREYSITLSEMGYTWKNGNNAATSIDPDITYIHIADFQISKDFNWKLYQTFNAYKDGIMVLNLDNSASILYDINRFFHSINRDYELADKEVSGLESVILSDAVENTRVGKFLTTYGGFRKLSNRNRTIMPFQIDDTRTEFVRWPSTAVSLMETTYRNQKRSVMLIDPVNKLVALGDAEVFYYTYGEDINGYRRSVLRNTLLYVINAAKYGSHFTDMLRDDQSVYFKAPEEPWSAVWGSNKWPDYQN